MRLEQLPTVLGALVALLGLFLLWDSASGDGASAVPRERRRRERADRDRLGEAVLGLGTLCMAAALIGRDTWRFGNVAVIAGTILLVVGAALNVRFLRELLVFRGPARRQDERAPRGAEADRYVFEPGQGAGARPGVAAAPADSTATVPPPAAPVDRPARPIGTATAAPDASPTPRPADPGSPGAGTAPPPDPADVRLRIR